MTLIEFFDKASIVNICACLRLKPSRIVLVGNRRKIMEKYAERYRKVLSERGIDTEILCCAVGRNNLPKIVKRLSVIVEKSDECVFDLTGGEELYLVAAGIVFEKYKDRKIAMHRFNIRGNSLCITNSCDSSENRSKTPEISVPENIRIYGGDVVYSDQKPDATYRWDFSEDFKADIEKMWLLCRKDTKYWNNQIGVIASSLEKKETSTANFKKNKAPDESFLKNLLKLGLIKAYRLGKEDFDIVYKNPQVKRCLTKAGQILEMKVCTAAMECTGKDGKAVYNDVMNGVYIDWDGELSSDKGGYDTENEIDVMMMKGIIPVFVSCKNGFIDIDELYKLSTVSHRFGAQYAKKVLVTTNLEKSGEFAKYFRERAKDMNIHLVENICECSDKKLKRILAGLWKR